MEEDTPATANLLDESRKLRETIEHLAELMERPWEIIDDMAALYNVVFQLTRVVGVLTQRELHRLY